MCTEDVSVKEEDIKDTNVSISTSEGEEKDLKAEEVHGVIKSSHMHYSSTLACEKEINGNVFVLQGQ